MSVSQKKPNQHLENLIKADGWRELPLWYREFIHDLMMIGQQTHVIELLKKSDELRGYIKALYFSNVIYHEQFCNLDHLRMNARDYALNKNKIGLKNLKDKFVGA